MIQYIPVTTKHLDKIRTIYNWYVANSTVSFDLDAANLDKMKKLTIHEDIRYCSYVILDDEQVIGYVMLSPFIQKHSCHRSAEVTIYLANEYARKGIGGAALDFIEKQAVQNGFHTLLAVICTENESSMTAFSKRGYVLKGIIEQVAYKFDRFLDVSYYQKLLN